MHEIISVQLGQRANYLATHFWNTQESYFTYGGEEESPVDHDILFRPGIGVDGTETFTPRTLVYDLKGGFGNLRKINALYELEEDRNGVPRSAWNGATLIHRQPEIAPNSYQKSLEEGLEPPVLTSASVRYWSDFNRVYFHPKSIVQLNEYELNSSLMPFENWDAGEDLFDSLDKEHDLLDRDVRSFAEEADRMQGFQIFTGVDDAWGGFAARYVDRLRDEYGKSTIWVWGLEDGLGSVPRMQQFAKSTNSARSLSSISPQSSLYIPLSPPNPSSLPPYLNLEPNSHWYLSALLSTAVESVTLPSRLKPTGSSSRETLDTLAAALNVNGKQHIAKLQMSIIANPANLSNGNLHCHPSIDTADQGRMGDNRLYSQERSRTNGGYHDTDNQDPTTELESPNLDIDFFPAPSSMSRNRRHDHSRRKVHVFGQTETSRGHPSSRTGAASPHGPDNDGHSRSQRRALNLPIHHQPPFTPLPFPILSSFPSDLFRSGAADDAAHPATLNVTTRLSTTTDIAVRIKEMRGWVAGRSVGVEEREALGNALGEIEEGFVDGWDEGSDSGDDDF